MEKKYTVESNGVIWYEENGFKFSFMPDPANSDYQRYLNPEAEETTPTIEVTND
jgi:hypothetical protein